MPFIGKSTNSMVIFNSKLLVYQRVIMTNMVNSGKWMYGWMEGTDKTYISMDVWLGKWMYG